MKHYCLIITLLIVIVSLSPKPVVKSDSDSAIISDQNLAEVVKKAVGLGPNDPISKEKLKKIKKLDAVNIGIRTLSGIENLTSLTSLRLGGNHIIHFIRCQNPVALARGCRHRLCCVKKNT